MATLLTTQFRGVLPGIGPGEIAGIGFILLCIGQPLRIPGWALWLVVLFLAGFLIGTVANQIHGASPQISLRDIGAICFALAFSVCAVSHLQQQTNPAVALAQGMAAAVVVQSIPLFLLVADVHTGAWLTDNDQPGLPFLSRYVGFSDNPNQLGVLLCAYPFLVAHAFVRAHGLFKRTLWAFALVLGLALSVLIKSNTVFAAYILCSAVSAMLFLMRWHRPSEERISLWGLSAAVLAGLVALAAFFTYASESVDKTGDADANGRFQRWQNATQGVIESFGLGVGPGGQSGETQPFQGEEAHNFLLDITLQGGVISLAGYLLLFTGAVVLAWRHRSLVLVTVLLAIFTQQVAHYTARQPMAWIFVFLPFALLCRPTSGREQT